MPNRSGNTKRKKRNEKAKKVEVAPPADATCTELPSEAELPNEVGGAEASTISGGGKVLESKENLTEGEKSIGRDDEKSENPQDEEKKKKKRKRKKKKSGQKDENNDLPIDSSVEKEGTVGEKTRSSEVTKEDSVCENSSGIDSCEKITVADAVKDESEEIAAHEQLGVAEDLVVMPNRSGNTKRKKRNEKAKKVEVAPPADAASTELPNEAELPNEVVGAQASTISGGGEVLESKENLTEGEKSIGRDDEKSKNPQDEEKKKKGKRKEKKSGQKDENNNVHLCSRVLITSCTCM